MRWLHAYNGPDPVEEPLFPSLPSCGSEPRRRHDWPVAARSAVKEGDEVETLHAGSDRGCVALDNKDGDGVALNRRGRRQRGLSMGTETAR